MHPHAYTKHPFNRSTSLYTLGPGINFMFSIVVASRRTRFIICWIPSSSVQILVFLLSRLSLFFFLRFLLLRLTTGCAGTDSNASGEMSSVVSGFSKTSIPPGLSVSSIPFSPSYSPSVPFFLALCSVRGITSSRHRRLFFSPEPY